MARPDVGVLLERVAAHMPASMEGRAMARPDVARIHTTWAGGSSLQWRAEQWLGQTLSWRMRESVSVVLQWRAEQWLGQTRPLAKRCRHRPHRFNGGPSNGSARHGLAKVESDWPELASMEGRAMARPDSIGHAGNRMVVS